MKIQELDKLIDVLIKAVERDEDQLAVVREIIEFFGPGNAAKAFTSAMLERAELHEEIAQAAGLAT